MKKLLAVVAAAATLMIGSIVSAQTATTHTMTGTVVTATDENLVVETSTGRMTFKLDSMLDRVRYNDLKPGTRIQFTHKTDDQGVLLVTDVNTLTEPATPSYTQTEPDRTTTTTTDDRYAADRLPQTASPFAILAVVGAAALAVGAAMRRRNSKKMLPAKPRES